MKVMISVDIEGIAGIAHWDEALHDRPGYPHFRELMTNEAIAACNGAKAAGATEIFVRDAHETARNLDVTRMPEGVRLIRGWSGHPYMMVQELDEKGIAVSAHSACHSGDLDPSHVLRAMAVPETHIHGTLRISLSRFNTGDEVEMLCKVLPAVVEKSRQGAAV